MNPYTALSSALPSAFSSPEALGRAFGDGLSRLLAEHDEPGDLGVYILALANAAYDPSLWAGLRPRLAARHDQLLDRVRDSLRAGRPVRAPEDDLLVFLQLATLGFEHVAPRESRALDPWEVQYNPVRALRPPRASGRRFPGLCVPFEPQGFHFGKPFLDREIFWSGPLLDRSADLFYNKFPFVPLHGLLVPDRDRGLPQWLTPELHGWAWRLTEDLGVGLPGFGLAYNSLGAHASVNHLHFQTFLRPDPLPVEDPRFRHNGGATPYPADCQHLRDPLDAWLAIDELHRRGCPYNLLYRPGRLWLLGRRPQGDQAPPAWSGGLAWYELAGGAAVYSRADYLGLSGADLADALAATRPAPPVSAP